MDKGRLLFIVSMGMEAKYLAWAKYAYSDQVYRKEKRIILELSSKPEKELEEKIENTERKNKARDFLKEFLSPVNG